MIADFGLRIAELNKGVRIQNPEEVSKSLGNIGMLECWVTGNPKNASSFFVFPIIPFFHYSSIPFPTF
jgi:hypothetical protein